jgi:hypothetical protein
MAHISADQKQENVPNPTASRRQAKNGSHKATEITKKSAAEVVSCLRGFVALCEKQVFVLLWEQRITRITQRGPFDFAQGRLCGRNQNLFSRQAARNAKEKGTTR